MCTLPWAYVYLRPQIFFRNQILLDYLGQSIQTSLSWYIWWVGVETCTGYTSSLTHVGEHHVACNLGISTPFIALDPTSQGDDPTQVSRQARVHASKGRTAASQLHSVDNQTLVTLPYSGIILSHSDTIMQACSFLLGEFDASFGGRMFFLVLIRGKKR